MGGRSHASGAVGIVLALVAALIVVVVPGDPAESAHSGTLELVSLQSDGTGFAGASTLRTYDYGSLPAANDGDFYAVGEAMSGDGCRVAFTNQAFDVDTGDWYDVFLRDRCVDPPTTEQMSIGVDDSEVEFQPFGTSDMAAISNDGQHVVFASLDPLHPDGDTNEGSFSVYVRDLSGPTPRTELISRWPVCFEGGCGAGPLAGDSYNPAISANGRFVAFTYLPASTATSRVLLYDRDADQDGIYDETAWAPADPLPGVTLRVLGGTWDAPPNGDSYDPSISDDGSVVAFTTVASSILDVVGGSGEQQVVAVEIAPNEAEPGTSYLIAADDAGDPGNDTSAQPSISADGTKVAFTSISTNLVPGVGNGSTSHVYLRDRTAGTTTLVSADSDEVPFPDGSDSSDPAMSGDGDAVAFTYQPTADLLVPPEQVLLRQVSAGTTDRVSAVSDTDPAGEGEAPIISALGDAVGFQSPATFGIEEPDNAEYDVWVRSLAPALAITPDPLNLGAVDIGVTSGPGVATVTNVGAAAVFAPTAAELVLGGTNPLEFTLVSTTCVGQRLIPGATCTIDFTVTPAAEGVRSATITINRPNLGVPLPSATLVGTGIARRPAIQITPDPVDHGTADVGDGETTDRVATVTSIGDAPAPLFGAGLLSLSGPQAAEFSVVATTCQDVTLNPGATCTITTRFAPTDLGVRTATLTVDGGGPGLVDTAELFGVGDAVPAIIIEPDPLHHGTVDLGESSDVRVATVRSVGLVPAPLFGAGLLSVGGPQAGEFAIVSTTCQNVTLDPGEICTVRSRFTPAAAGFRTASLTVSGNLPGPTASTTYTGVGQEEPPPPPPDEPDLVPVLMLTPNPVDFGLHLVGDVPASQLVTARSVGNGPVIIGPGALSITGPDPGSFSVMVDGCSGLTLDPGEECTIRITGNPALDGPRTADLLVASNSVTSPDRVTLLIAGEYRPTLQTNPGVGKIGRVTLAIGAGYPPDQLVVLSWLEGGSFLTFAQIAGTDAEGSFQAPIHILDHDRLGPRTLVGTAFSGVSASAPFLVELPTAAPPTFLGR